MTPANLTGLTESEAKGIQHFAKPKEGTWTEGFGLGTDPVPLYDCFDKDFFEKEKEAVFKKSWLYVGRTTLLPKAGSYFTKELTFLDLSIIVVRGLDDTVRAFHNVCTHRGNKLLWDDYPAAETKGVCRSIACKYHGWRFDLDGEVSYVHNAPEFFDLNAADLSLKSLHCEVWAGFIFVNVQEQPQQSLREFLGEGVCKLEEYPFEKMTHIYVMELTIGSNWKLLMDAFQELYHVPYVHGRMNAPLTPSTGVDKVPFMMPNFAIFGKHRCYTSGGPYANFGVRSPRPLDDVFRSTFYGPVDKAEVGPLGNGINPGNVQPWGLDSWQLYPNLDILLWNPNWFLTYEYWPVDADHHRFIWHLYFVPPTNVRERLAQEQTVLSVREFAIQDAGAVEAMQVALRSNAVKAYQFNDQEVLVRHLHHHIYADVAAYEAELAEQAGSAAKTAKK